ncbi:MAG TPA: acyl-CoA dehydrogenase family protein [Burkholderiaceae bacterium]|nr:acyl-CoA dehydrogenase family protein [Burkholderiaceae bacterium]
MTDQLNPVALPAEDAALLARVRELAAERIGPRANEVALSDDFAWDTFRLLAREGVIATAFPRALGGTEGSMQLRVRIIEELARVCSTAASLVTGTDLAGRPIAAGAADSLAREIVPRLARGEIQSAFALTERKAGSDVAGLTTIARRDGDDFVLDGVKRFITRAPVADLFVVVARLDGVPGAKGLSAFLVDRGSPGLTVGPTQPKLGWYGVPIAEVHLQHVRVPRERLLGREGEGFALAQDTLVRARIGHGAIALGRAQGALEMAAQYAARRSTFGKKLAEHQGVQWMVADMATRIEAARCLVRSAAARYDAGDADVSVHASMAKLYATDLGMQVTVDCLQLAGGNGYLKELPFERFMRDAKLNQIGEGSSEIHKTVIGRHVLKRAAQSPPHPCLDLDALEL